MIYRFHQQRALALMLLSLHGVMLWGFDSALAATLLLSHYGLFLLWQPIWRGERPLTPGSTLLFLAGGALLLLTLNWWVLAFWQAALFGLLGGRVFSTREKLPRTVYLLAAAYLLAMLTIWVVPKLLGHAQDEIATYYIAAYVMPLLPATLLFLPSQQEPPSEAPPLDFFYSLVLFLLAVILVLGSFAIAASSHARYPEVLIRMLFAIASVLVLMSWLWNPRAGFAGVGQLLSRYLLSVGMPFEQWLNRVTSLAEADSTPGEFMTAALDEVAALPWVSGGRWKTLDSAGTFGSDAPYSATFSYHDFELTLHARHLLTPVVMLHIKLLTQLLGEFHEAKKREQSLREQSYMRAVYETGARLTHDIKNLLQSLSALCTAAESAGESEEAQLAALIRRQLPILSRRLELTLEKLQTPQDELPGRIRAATWWRKIKQRYSGAPVAFSSHGISPTSDVYGEVFDNVLDNLLQNVLEKGRNEPDITISVILGDSGQGPYLEVCDSGSAAPPEIARQLFRSRVDSENGLGIGLYHAARQAERVGYILSMPDNQDGRVRFLMQKTVP